MHLLGAFCKLIVKTDLRPLRFLISRKEPLDFIYQPLVFLCALWLISPFIFIAS